MKLEDWQLSQTTPGIKQKLLGWLNLRPEESARTVLMFLFYTTTSVGVLWFEVSVAALFLGEYGAEGLPWIYLASSGIGAGLGLLYSWMQKFLPLRYVIFLIAVLMAVPVLLLRVAMHPALLGGYAIFLLRLWVEGIYVLNELTTTITANQLFNIREIKRTFPFISSGILMADVLSGFSLPVLRSLIGLPNVLILSSGMMLVGALTLLHIGRTYHQFFPDSPRRRMQEKQPDFTARRLRGPLLRYVVLIVSFFVLIQVLLLLIDFQYLSQLEKSLNVQVEDIADFLALFSGILGLFELLTQWFVSSRMIERLGVFFISMVPPALVVVISAFSLVVLRQPAMLFWGMISLKFVDELLRYTLVASTSPVLFQPVPDTMRSRVQSMVRGVAEPISIGVTGAGMLLVLKVFRTQVGSTNSVLFQQLQDGVFTLFILVAALAWLLTVWWLRSRYLELLVLSAERGQLSLSDVDLRSIKRAVVDALDRPGTEADKQSCIELLTHIDPKNVGDVLSPLLARLTPRLQRQSLEAMLDHPSLDYLDRVRSLIQSPLQPEVLAVALRYIWLTEPSPNIQELRHYLQSQQDPVVRGTAASLMLRRGNSQERAEATATLRRMLTHTQERERVMGCRALGEAVYMQALRLYIKPLLQDESLRVRRALLEAIAATHLEEYYPSLLRGLRYQSTREAAMQALTRLENDAIPLLLSMAEDIHQPDIVRNSAWKVMGRIGTLEALNALVSHLVTSWGGSRRSILRILLKLPHDAGIEAVGDRLGRRGIETLMNQELMLIGQVYAALLDLTEERVGGREADLLRRSLRYAQSDAQDRLFLLMRFLYPSSAIQAASFNLLSGSPENMARGLEILDNTVDLPSKRALLSVLDRRTDYEKLQSLSELVPYRSMLPSDRLRYLLDLRHFLSEWALACCFHLARRQLWRVKVDQAIACLRHPAGFVREAVLSYLQVASPRTLLVLLPQLGDDPNPLVASQVRHLLTLMEHPPLPLASPSSTQRALPNS
jgi:HEAT repeat protein